MLDLNNLKKQYEVKYSHYQTLCKEVIRQLEVLFEENTIKLTVPIHYRVKEWDSIVDKCQRYNLNPKK